MLRPSLDPGTVVLSAHAVARYGERRQGGDAETGLRRLLSRAAVMQTPPAQTSPKHEGVVRRYRVGEYRLIMSADLTTLITLYRENR